MKTIEVVQNPNSDFIMDCTHLKVIELAGNFLNVVDDLQQIVGEDYLDELSSCYDRLEFLYKFLNPYSTLIPKYRNDLRSIFKEVYKIASIYNYQWNI